MAVFRWRACLSSLGEKSQQRGTTVSNYRKGGIHLNLLDQASNLTLWCIKASNKSDQGATGWVAFFAVLISTLMACMYVSMIPQDLARSSQYKTSAVGLLHNLLQAFQLVQNQTREHSSAIYKYNM
jgi:hypothetical protein